MATYTNICIEQCCGTLCQGLTEAVCGTWGPHIAETFIAPLWENCEQIVLVSIGKA